MDIAFKCPHCRQDLEVEMSAAGQTIACPACNQSITIPQPDASNMKVGIASHSSAAAKEEKHFAVPVTETPVQTLIKKPNPPLDAAAKDGPKTIRIRTIRHSDCKEVGKDFFDATVSDFLSKIGEDNLVSITAVSYSFLDIGTQKLLNDFGVLIVYKG